MRQRHTIEVIVKVGESAIGNSVQNMVAVKNGSAQLEFTSLEAALGLLPPESHVLLSAEGTVNNEVVHYFNRVIKNNLCFVHVDFSKVTELSSVLNSPFRGNERLASLFFPQNLVRINPEALAYCKALECVVIPHTVTEIGKGAFCECTTLRRLEFASPEGWFCEKENGECEPVPALSFSQENPALFVQAEQLYGACRLFKKSAF